eukprot:TRINITY_DN2815_c0_g1_i1.p1 TRINITY_DN2815_c0_g1~~TRINITY_DN2815_c0_g1_i1.p1  ORF type:complete len:475 (-),score=136.23 TRINITY_DN2815_c0_g1_i1:65-1489(-)
MMMMAQQPTMDTATNTTYLCLFSQAERLLEFMLPELESVARYFDVPLVMPEEHKLDCPFFKIRVRNEDDLKNMASRLVQVKGFYEIWGEGVTYEEVIASIDTNVPPEKMALFTTEDATFRCRVNGFGRKYTEEEQAERIRHFSHLPALRTKVSLNHAKHSFWLFEDVGVGRGKNAAPRKIFFCREIVEANRNIIDRYTLKKRLYLSTTSMAAELAFIIANLSLSGKGKLVFDPFVGSGSILVSCAAYGAHVIGSDIDPRVVRGKDGKNIVENFKQYGILDKLIDLIISDQSKPIWSDRTLFDAIVCDPPYGLRESARKVGRREGKNWRPIPQELRDDHVSSCVGYDVPDILVDLLKFAAKKLRMGGRLVYWFPAIIETYKEEHIPRHPCFKLLSNSEQKLSGRHARRLISMEKIAEYDENIERESIASATLKNKDFRHAIMKPKAANEGHSSPSRAGEKGDNNKSREEPDKQPQ